MLRTLSEQHAGNKDEEHHYYDYNYLLGLEDVIKEFVATTQRNIHFVN